MILEELSKAEQAKYLLALVLADNVGLRIVSDYDSADYDEVEAVEIDGRYWLYYVQDCIEVPTIGGRRRCGGWVLESIAPIPRGYMATMDPELPAPVPEVDRKGQRLDDLVAEIAGLLAKDRAYEDLYNNAMEREYHG